MMRPSHDSSIAHVYVHIDVDGAVADTGNKAECRYFTTVEESETDIENDSERAELFIREAPQKFVVLEWCDCLPCI